MHTVFYEVFFISDKQLFYVMKFLNAMTSWKLQLHNFLKKSQVVKLEMFFDNYIEHNMYLKVKET